ncbi:orn/Lys/Arg decarboxylase [Desmospora sp. 8437]|nr:orn/Lys/Arg decarboxylase [Desmospora sp. 8437]
MNQEEAPLFEALCFHKDQNRGNYHVPGHKQGKAFDPLGRELFRDLLTIDLTEIAALDDLHQPEGVIRQAQELAAAAFGADRTFFLVGGSTAGNISLILAACQPGDQLIIHRASHQSVFNGCHLAGVRPVFLSGRGDVPLGGEISGEDLEEAILRHPGVKGVFLTSPDYFGRLQPISQLAKICHRHGLPLMVDEAHGAHFQFHPHLPPPALTQGADGVVQSTHKMLTAMTMGSMLHLKGSRLDRDRVAKGLGMIQSSSPSYPLMASLDLARRLMATGGQKELQKTLHQASLIREQVAGMRHLQEEVQPGGDPLKLNIRADRRISGYKMLKWLEKQGIDPELADHEKVLFVLSPGMEGEESVRLIEALHRLDQAISGWEEDPRQPVPDIPVLSESHLSWDRLRSVAGETVSLPQAEGRMAAEMVVPYPPGVPSVLPGEMLSAEQIRHILHTLDKGGRVRGLTPGFPPGLHVIK